jgi:hypothetical protein
MGIRRADASSARQTDSMDLVVDLAGDFPKHVLSRPLIAPDKTISLAGLAAPPQPALS